MAVDEAGQMSADSADTLGVCTHSFTLPVAMATASIREQAMRLSRTLLSFRSGNLQRPSERPTIGVARAGRRPGIVAYPRPRVGGLLLLMLGVALMPSAWADGAGGAAGTTTGGSGTAGSSLGNGGSGGANGVAGGSGGTGVDSNGNSVAGGSGGAHTTSNTGSAASGTAGATAETLTSSATLAAGNSIVGAGGGGGGYQDLGNTTGVSVYQSGDFNGGNGGDGVSVSGSNLSYDNQGSITGGGGGGGGHNSFYLPGGSTSATVGDSNGGLGGNAVTVVGSNVTLTNAGTLTGGSGGGGGTAYTYAGGGIASSGSANGGDGGAGLYITGSGATVTNDGSIVGGNGGTGGLAHADGSGTPTLGSANGGAGGNGVTLAGGSATLTNNATISGGNGGTPGSEGATKLNGAGGVGVAVTSNGNTIINAGSISGGLSGDGSTRANAISISGSNNTVELQAGYSFTGNVVVNSGSGNILSLGGSSDASFDLATIATTAPASYTGTVQYYGFSGFAKTGSSTWTLTGSTTSSTAWRVDGGTLLVTGSLANAAISINSGGTLDGSGTVGSTTVNSGGTLAASTLGSGLTINGDLTFASGSTYLVTLDNSGASGLTTVNGNLSIASGSTLKLASVAGTYTAGTSYTIATYSGTESGSFSSINYSMAYVTPTVSYSGGTVSMVLNANSSFQTSGFTLVTSTSNQQALSGALNRIYAAGGNTLTSTLLTASDSEARSALSAMSGDLVGSVSSVASANIHGAQDAIGQRLAAVDMSAAGSAVTLDSDPWIAVSLAQQRQSTSDTGASGYIDHSTAISFGHDHALTSEWLAGFGFAANSDALTYRDVRASERSDGGQASLYLRYRPEAANYFVKAVASYGAWQNVLSRQLTLGTLSGATRGKFNVNSASLYAETGMLLTPTFAALHLEPYTGLFVARMHRQAFSESTQSGSDAFALTYGALTSTETSTVLGLRLRPQQPDNGAADATPWSWNADLSWRRRLGADKEAIKVAFVNAADYAYSVQGSTGARDMLRLSAGASYALSDLSTAYAQTYVASGQGTQSYGVTAGVRWWW
jgi:uncharacterized protein with beta-barrel porin domain